MNTVEHIVESYFRLCKQCFTICDVKVFQGNNRQIDLLAISLKDDAQYHVECSVTHCENWCPTVTDLEREFGRKFSGVPKQREGANTDAARRKRYGGVIHQTYRIYGLDPLKLLRVWVCWVVIDPVNLRQMLNDYYIKTGQRVEVVSFRDTILPELQKSIGTSNYDDEVLRTFSLLKQATAQTVK
jgi:hypothetical protein